MSAKDGQSIPTLDGNRQLLCQILIMFIIIIKITIIYFAMQRDEEFVFREKRFSVVC